MSGGAPVFIMCLCLQSRKDVSCSLIRIPCKVYLVDQKLSCAKIYFLLLARNYKAQSGLAIKIEIYIG